MCGGEWSLRSNRKIEGIDGMSTDGSMAIYTFADNIQIHRILQLYSHSIDLKR